MALLQEDIFRLSLSVVGRVAACIAVQLLCSQSDADRSLGPALDPRAAVRIAGMFCAALRTPARGLARQLQTHARPISLVRGGLAYLAWQFKPGWPHWPLAPTFSRPFAAGSESKQAACQALFPPRKVAETKTSTPQAC
jgi:hypothetical protein